LWSLIKKKRIKPIINNKIPCHHQSSRVKTFESARLKLAKVNIHDANIYKLYDLIGFRFVFYTKDDLFKFFHNVKKGKIITYTMNYINEPKENGYKAYHFRYVNYFEECLIDEIECQLYLIEK
jgi:ppGpp synthetase/RelA/SpoT-type nucleotidyltranferase